ncbi:alginate lyase family protein [Flavobacterium sp.]|uniref:alginate lyase family protein n=1 Tax=Flavobacterium sp. TaxID=239 RepID=UPI0038FC86CC
MTHKTKYIALLFTLVSLNSVLAQEVKVSSNNFPKTLVLKGEALERNYQLISVNDFEKTKALKTLLAKADKILKEGKLYSVMNKKQLPPSGDKHDYMSTGPYWWPDPTKPDGLPYIRKDGLRNPTYYDISDTREIDRMRDDTESLALAYYFTKEDKYAKFASKLIQTWFLDAATLQNPNLNFGQGIPGINTGRGIGIIETRGLFRVIDAAILLQESESWSKEDHQTLQKWFSDYLVWLTQSPIGKDEAIEHNNHGTHYSVQVIDYALFTGQPEIVASEIEVFKNRMESQIKADGSQPFELERTKSWDYVNMNLDGYFLVAQLAENSAINLWQYETKQGITMRKCLDWMVPYLKNEKKWDFEQIKTVGYGETIRLLKIASQKYSNPAYDALAKAIDIKTYQSELNQLTF